MEWTYFVFKKYELRSTLAKNFEMSRIHFSWFLLHGGDDGAGGFDEEKLERRPRESMRRNWSWWSMR